MELENFVTGSHGGGAAPQPLRTPMFRHFVPISFSVLSGVTLTCAISETLWPLGSVGGDVGYNKVSPHPQSLCLLASGHLV